MTITNFSFCDLLFASKNFSFIHQSYHADSTATGSYPLLMGCERSLRVIFDESKVDEWNMRRNESHLSSVLWGSYLHRVLLS